jgi:coenzyme F420-reducing hydrogenase alpha subunit
MSPTPDPPSTTRVIEVKELARVEGEGAMYVKVTGDRVEQVELRIYEPPRFFEAFLRGRDHAEAPDITSRICGICPIAYQTSATNAMEDALGIVLPPTLRTLRRLLYCGEWIESHALHVLMLHAPDFLGYESGIDLARDHRSLVERGLALKKAGNTLVTAIGGREIHPVNVRVGGFYRLPRPGELAAVRADLVEACDVAVDLGRTCATFSFPALERDYTFVCLHDPDRYAIEDGRVISSHGLDIAVQEYENHFIEEHVARSNALHSRLADGGSYLVGPAARIALNGAQLTPRARALADEIGLTPAALRNPFRSILARCVELVLACEEAISIIDDWTGSGAPAVVARPRAGTGCGASEAPRGLLYHSYRLAADGTIEAAKIVPPTSQNQRAIEEDLVDLLERNLDLDDDALQRRCEQAIRNYDPCISCATHFLTLAVERA